MTDRTEHPPPQGTTPSVNFADPTFEPSDQQLQELSREAFADVAARHQEALRALRAKIASLRAEVRVTASSPTSE